MALSMLLSTALVPLDVWMLLYPVVKKGIRQEWVPHGLKAVLPIPRITYSRPPHLKKKLNVKKKQKEFPQ